MNQSINTDSKNNSKEPQQTYRLGTVSIKIMGEGGEGSQPRPQLLPWLKTYSCSVRVKVFLLINGSSRETNKSQINTMMKQR